MMDSVASPIGFKQITNLATAVGVGTVPPGTQVALINAEEADIRWRDDGTDPTSTVGMLLPAGQTLTYIGPIEKIRFIQVDSGAILNITTYGR
jgi:hypothetical protein